MEISEFLQKARELTEILERFEIAFARYSAVTCVAGDGICIDYDRSDRFAASLHRMMLKAHPNDKFVISYDPLNIIYESFTPLDEGTFTDVEIIQRAAESFKSMLIETIGESYYSESANMDYHVLYTSAHGVCISARDFESLERSVFRTEEYMRIIKKRNSVRNEVIVKAGVRNAEAIIRHRILSTGSEYLREIRQTKRKD